MRTGQPVPLRGKRKSHSKPPAALGGLPCGGGLRGLGFNSRGCFEGGLTGIGGVQTGLISRRIDLGHTSNFYIISNPCSKGQRLVCLGLASDLGDWPGDFRPQSGSTSFRWIPSRRATSQVSFPRPPHSATWLQARGCVRPSMLPESQQAHSGPKCPKLLNCWPFTTMCDKLVLLN